MAPKEVILIIGSHTATANPTGSDFPMILMTKTSTQEKVPIIMKMEENAI